MVSRGQLIVQYNFPCQYICVAYWQVFASGTLHKDNEFGAELSTLWHRRVRLFSAFCALIYEVMQFYWLSFPFWCKWETYANLNTIKVNQAWRNISGLQWQSLCLAILESCGRNLNGDMKSTWIFEWMYSKDSFGFNLNNAFIHKDKLLTFTWSFL